VTITDNLVADPLAGGTVLRDRMPGETAAAPATRIPFHCPCLGPEEEREVIDTLRSGWLTTGPKTKRFERDFAAYVGAKHAIGLNSCTAALHLSLLTHDVGPGDEVITSPITFASTANVIEHLGATPVFVDVQPDTLNLDPDQLKQAVTPRTRAIIPVHFAGHPCDLDAIHAVADRSGQGRDDGPKCTAQSSQRVVAACVSQAVRPAGTPAATHKPATLRCTANRGCDCGPSRGCDCSPNRGRDGGQGIPVIEDAAHAVGSVYRGRKIGSLHRGRDGDPNQGRDCGPNQGHEYGISRTTCFSFYATKNITTGEGGMITTDNDALADRLRVLSLHGISADAWKRHAPYDRDLDPDGGYKHWDIIAPGFKYNMFDMQACLGIHQLAKIKRFGELRRQWTEMYDTGFADMPEIVPLKRRAYVESAHHLYVVQFATERLTVSRDQLMALIQRRGIGIGVHFRPIHLHPYYRRKYGYQPGMLPIAEHAGDRVISLPLFPTMTEAQVRHVIHEVRKLVTASRR